MDNRFRAFTWKEEGHRANYIEQIVVRDDECGIGYDIGIYYPDPEDSELLKECGITNIYRMYRNMHDEDGDSMTGVETVDGSTYLYSLDSIEIDVFSKVKGRYLMIKGVIGDKTIEEEVLELISNRMERPKDIDLECLTKVEVNHRWAYMSPCIIGLLEPLWEKDEELMADLTQHPLMERFSNSEMCSRCKNLLNCINSNSYGHKDLWNVEEINGVSRPYLKAFSEI